MKSKLINSYKTALDIPLKVKDNQNQTHAIDQENTMRKLLPIIALLLLSQTAIAATYGPTAAWDRDSVRQPFIDGIEAMAKSMRKHKPENDELYGYGYGNPYNPFTTNPFSTNRFNWNGSDGRTPFPSDDPWLDELPLGSEDSPFFRIAPVAKLSGRWLGQYGDGIWFKRGWIRFYRVDDYHDGRYKVKGQYLYVYLNNGLRVTRFRYAVEDDLLALRSNSGTTYLYQRFEEEDDDDSSDDELGSDD
ncbi:hypothetical protein BOV90_11035 [Solemya velum gill symbiont]|uniref:Uncharacterized protein n=1 Tax=Solemya velum gill symbiont TaxID=2340 RepID=A0A1T2EUH5_SOVGS|nr:hypothetical protein BOV88_00710 [Solemya velum gill symbiont]OOY38141.1 hypothetical protein BOV89_03370 [Solemya velum gill symbiont]OOY39121.1 hypothetical protein BOV90_11035 [Solemya velum gill symbiont]OOY44598.1 hypothetical protein BOV92_08285 [Solemya velum gill symbiont]OOY48714.1 hypothetical protein BOV93_01020 [Solemya velum gill symbiont]